MYLAELYAERAKCVDRMKELECKIADEEELERDKILELKCNSEDDSITAEERRCIFCGHGTLIDETCTDWGDIPEEQRVHNWFVRCPSCFSRGPSRKTKREAVYAFENPHNRS